MRIVFVAAVAVLGAGVFGCGGGGSEDLTAADGGVLPTGGGGGGGGGGGSDGGSSGTGSAMTEFCQLMLAEGCGGITATAENVSACTAKLDTAVGRGCGTFLNDAYTCQKPHGESGLACYSIMGVEDVYTTVATCEESFAAGTACASAVNDTDCYSVSCKYNQDCPSGWSCNNKTEKCFNTSAKCGGLPCRYNQDCPSGFTCNNALEVCVVS